MKIAILFSGRINDNLDQYKNIMKNLVINNDVDFFISYPINTNNDIIQNVVKLYNPKKIIESDERYFNIDKYHKKHETIAHNVMCMYLSRTKLNNEFKRYVEENNINYDIVIATRIDLIFKTNIDFNDLIKNIENNEICIPNPTKDWGGINDQFAIGSFDTITEYLNLYNSLFELLESGIILHPETLLLEYLNRIQMKIIRFELEYHIERY